MKARLPGRNARLWRHLHVGVADEFFGLRQRGAATEQLGDAGMPASCLEIGDPIVRLPARPGRVLQL